MIEIYALDAVFAGLAVAVVAWVWLIIAAFQQKTWWGLGSLILPPIALLFALRHAQRAVGPLVLLILGSFVAVVPASYALLAPRDSGLLVRLRDTSQQMSTAGRALESYDAHKWMDDRAFYLQIGGLVLAVAAWFWLIARAFRQHRGWGLSSLLIPPVGGVLFAGRYPSQGTSPLLVCLLGLLVATTPAIYAHCVPLDLGPRERLVDGELHLTLTGWDRKDYSLLRSKPDVVVLQMANADVTDESLKPLHEMKGLRELDLSDTQVTDAGLMILKDLPALTRLRLAKTKITDQGFRDALSGKDSLMQLDLRGTAVSHEAGRAWHDAKAERRILQ
jgi:hypothetical protein